LFALPLPRSVERFIADTSSFVIVSSMNPGLRSHPLNPMTDPDIRRWLARQCQTAVGLVPWPTVHAGAHQLRAALCEAATHNETLMIVDTLTEKDLITIDRACIHAPLLTFTARRGARAFGTAAASFHYDWLSGGPQLSAEAGRGAGTGYAPRRLGDWKTP